MNKEKKHPFELSNQEMLLVFGEMTAGELRTAKAVLSWAKSHYDRMKNYAEHLERVRDLPKIFRDKKGA